MTIPKDSHSINSFFLVADGEQWTLTFIGRYLSSAAE